MKKKANKHLGMDQDELAASFEGRIHTKTKSAKSKKENEDEAKEEGWGLTKEEIAKWNKKLNASAIVKKPKKRKLALAH